MLATVMNVIFLQVTMESIGLPPRVQTVFRMSEVPDSQGKTREVHLSCVAMCGMSGGQVICINGVIGVITGGDSELRTTYAVCSETVDQVIRCWLASR